MGPQAAVGALEPMSGEFAMTMTLSGQSGSAFGAIRSERSFVSSPWPPR